MFHYIIKEIDLCIIPDIKMISRPILDTILSSIKKTESAFDQIKKMTTEIRKCIVVIYEHMAIIAKILTILEQCTSQGIALTIQDETEILYVIDNSENKMINMFDLSHI